MDLPASPLSIVTASSKSGYRWIRHDPHLQKTGMPWRIFYKGYKSPGFNTAYNAAMSLALYRVHKEGLQTTTTKPAKKRRSTTPTSSFEQSVQPVLPGSSSSDWMTKASVKFNVPACDLFGARITMRHRGSMRMAVIKQWQPCSDAPFGIVFDEYPDTVYQEDLFRKGRRDWSRVSWESDDIWETIHLRPLCPQCAHPLGEGRDAWTICVSCGKMEPGISSSAVLSRLRSDDPHRRTRVDYTESTDD